MLSEYTGGRLFDNEKERKPEAEQTQEITDILLFSFDHDHCCLAFVSLRFAASVQAISRSNLGFPECHFFVVLRFPNRSRFLLYSVSELTVSLHRAHLVLLRELRPSATLYARGEIDFRSITGGMCIDVDKALRSNIRVNIAARYCFILHLVETRFS